MSEKLPRDMNADMNADMDAALAALARAERAARPEVSAGLRARVLTDAAEVAAEMSARRRPTVTARPAPAFGGRPGLLGWLRGLDVWAGAAVAAALICLAAGLGVGYEAGDAILAGTGFGGEFQVARAGQADSVFLGEDVL